MEDFPGVRTRRQAARAANQEVQKPMNGHINGSAHPHEPVPLIPQKKENIFLFYPNIIGMSGPISTKLRYIVANRMISRILTDSPRPSISLLHASAPSHLLFTLQHILPPRRTRRGSGALLPAINPVRCRTRYDHRPVHYFLPARLPRISLATLGIAFSRLDQLGSSEPLHPHVCNLDDGWIGPEP